MIAQSKTGSSSQIIIITTTLFLSTSLLSKLTVAKMPGQNHFAEPNRYVLTFFSSNFNVESHILSTAGDPVSTMNRSEATASSSSSHQ
jgi:hypothetical protein